MALISIEEAFRKVTAEIASWTKKQISASVANKVDKVWGKGLSECDYTKADKTKVDKMPDGLLLTPEKKLYLTQNGSVINNSVADFSNFSIGGNTGPGGVVGTTIDVQSISPEEFAVVLDENVDVEVAFRFAPSTTYGYAYVYRGQSEQPLDTVKIFRGEVHLPVKQYLYSTGSTTLTIKFADSTGAFGVQALTYKITVASLSLTISNDFSDANPIESQSFDLSFDLVSTHSKNMVHIIIEGLNPIEIPVNDTKYHGRQSIEFPDTFQHGVYSMVVYAETEISEDVHLPSEIQRFKIMYIDGTDPLISSVCSITQAKQYEEFKIPFSAYVYGDTSPELTLTISKNGEIYSQRTAVAERGKRIEWPIVINSSLSGDVHFTIAYQDSYGTVLESVTHKIEILENQLDIDITRHNLVFDLNTDNVLHSDRTWASADASAVNVKFTDVNWDVSKHLFSITDKNGNVVKQEQSFIGTGWKTDQEGKTALRLSGNAMAEIEYPIFQNDWSKGVTLEMEFSIGDVNNRSAEVIQCLKNTIGLRVTADTASVVRGGGTLVKCNYTDGEKIHIAFCIERIGDMCLVTSYLNGVLSSASSYNAYLILNHTDPGANVKIGSPDCSIDFYSMRFYNTSLTHKEIQNNYIASSQKLDLILANKIYDGVVVNYDEVFNNTDLPIVCITGELPSAKFDTDKKANPNAKDYFVDVLYTNHLDKTIINEQTKKSDLGVSIGGPKIEVQGTSSEGYPRKNWKIKFSTVQQHADGQIPSKVFCLKADFAEATSTHNTGHANFVHNFYTNKSLPPFNLSDQLSYRTTIYGFPCVVFYKTSSGAKPVFHGKYNFNYDKGSEEAFGFNVEDPRYDKIQSWEFCENKYLACRFLQDPNGIVKDPDDPTDESKWHPVGKDDWKTWFDDRYFYDDDKDDKFEDFKRMYNWVYYTDQSKATNGTIDPYTQLPIGQYTDLNGNIHTTDSAAYRLAKFKKDFEQYFNLEFCLVYYLYTFVMLMVDQRAKNQFLTSWDGKTWYPWLYDNDTSFGINNNGHLIFDYYHEDTGNNYKNGDAYVYNGYDSVLWVNFAEAFSDDIKNLYASWRMGENPLLSYDKVVDNFITNHANKWPIAVYNEDAEFKYIEAFRGENHVATHLYQVKGTGAEHLKYFIKNRIMYCDSKWKAGDFAKKENAIILRVNEPVIADTALQPTAELSYTTFSNMYAGVAFGSRNGNITSQYTERDKEITFVIPEGESAADLDTYIYGADQISELTDLSRLYCGTINVSAATRLTRLIVGKKWYTDDYGVEHRYTNNTLTELTLTNNRLLKELNICNCTALTDSIDLSLCPDIQKVYAEGSSISSVILPSAGFLQEISLPSTITALFLENQQRLVEGGFKCDGYQNLTQVRIRNAKMVGTNKFPLKDLLGANGYDPETIVDMTIENIHWDVADEATLRVIINRLIEAKNNGASIVLTGSVELPSNVTVSRAFKETIHVHFPELNVIDKEKGFFVDYLNRDATIFCTKFVTSGSPAPRPEQDPEGIDDPIKGLQYNFVDWIDLPTSVTSNCVVKAQWQTKYAITFHHENGTQIGDPLWYNANEKPKDPVAAGHMSAPTKDSGTDDFRYVFNGWRDFPDIVKGPIKVYATFIKQFPVKFYNEGKLHDTKWVDEGGSAPIPSIPEKAKDDKYTYTFSEWIGDSKDNVTSPRELNAKYSHTEREYTVYFYRDSELLYNNNKNPVSYTKSLNPTSIYDYKNIKKVVDGKETDDYVCTGWFTRLDSDKSEIKYSAIFRYQAYLNRSWQNIIDDVGTKSISELKTLYPVGARMKLTFKAEDGGVTDTVTCSYGQIKAENVEVDVEVIGYEHDDRAGGLGKAKLTFFCKTLPNISATVVNQENNNAYEGWQHSTVRKFLNNTLFDCLTDELRSEDGIKTVCKYSDDGNGTNSKLVMTTDKLWIMSTAEIGGDHLKAIVSGQGELYGDTFSLNSQGANAANTKRIKFRDEGQCNDSWMTRTTYIHGNEMHYEITSAGAFKDQGSWQSSYIAFGFCI